MRSLRLLIRHASTIADYEIDAITLHKKPKDVRVAPEQTFTESPASPEFDAFKGQFPEEIKLLKSFLNNRKVNLSQASEKERADMLNRFKIVNHFGKPGRGSGSLKNLSLFCTTLKQNPTFFNFMFNLDVPDIQKYNTDTVKIEKMVEKDERLLFKDVLETAKREGREKQKNPTKQLTMSEAMDFIQSRIPPVKKRSLEDLSDISADRIRATYPVPNSVERKENTDNPLADQKTLNDFGEYLKSTQKQNAIRKEEKFRQQNAYEWIRSKNTGNPRLLENGNFFTPRCVPKTLIPIKSSSTIEWPFSRRNNLLFPSTQRVGTNKQFLILVGRKKVITSENPMGNDSLPEDMFTIFGKIDHPEKYIKRVNKLQKKGWRLIGGGGDKQFLVFERPVQRRVWKWIGRTIGTTGAFAILLFAVSFIFE